MKNTIEKEKKKAEIVYTYKNKDKYGHSISIAKCPYCPNFFTARTDSLNNGHTKSCGCLKHKRKRNKYYFPLGCNYGIGYYDNTDGFFIFDLEKFDCISKYYWYSRSVTGRKEPITTINGKTTSLARFLMQTPDGLEVDHINRNPNDNRMCNLRNCTHLENSHNRCSQKEDCIEYGDFSLKKSQEISKTIETNQYNNPFQFFGVLEKINELPEKHILKIQLRNLCRNKLNGLLSEDNENILLLKLIKDYKDYQNEAS